MNWNAIRGRVLPLVVSPEFVAATGERAPGISPLAAAPWVDGELTITLVVPDEGNSMRFLSEADLASFERSFAAVRTEALANLAARARGRLTIGLRHGVIARVEDPSPWFRASLLLLPDVRAQLADALGGPPVVALPDRDELVALAPGARAAWEKALPRLRREHEAAAHPLSDALFQATRGGLAVIDRLPQA
jgi:hypothetical protein